MDNDKLRQEIKNSLLEAQNLDIQHEYDVRNLEIIGLQMHVKNLEAHQNNITQSFAYKLTWPLRRFEQLFKKTDYKDALLLTINERKIQEKTTFNITPKFSIIVPLYNTPKEFLVDMINSVKRQTYKNWQLILVDASDDNHNYVKDTVQSFTKKDKRIEYKKLKENKGISANTNEAFSMVVGDYVCLFDHDDFLHPSALFYYTKEIEENSPDVIYCDELTFVDHFFNQTFLHYKPKFAPDNLLGGNYICHFLAVKKEVCDKVGLLNPECDGAQDHDYILRISEVTQKFSHIPKILYYWRAHEKSTASSVEAKPYVTLAGIKAVSEHLKRTGAKATVSAIEDAPSHYAVSYEVENEPLVSIIIPNKDNAPILKLCIDSILEKSTYKNYEIIIVENNSDKKETFDYYDLIQKNEKIKVVHYKDEFNYSLVCNFGADHSKGEQLLMLNNDTEVISPDFIEQMLMYNQRDNTAITGALLLYPNDRIQHAGVILGVGGVAAHGHRNYYKGEKGYAGKLLYTQNVSAVTGACLMVKRDLFFKVGGFCEKFKVAYNDVDLCLKMRELGYLVCMTPFAKLYHYESFSRGDDKKSEKRTRLTNEQNLFYQRYEKVLKQGDEYYNINLTRDKEDYSPSLYPYE